MSTLLNCTVISNSASFSGGAGIYGYGLLGRITNSIVTLNNPANIIGSIVAAAANNITVGEPMLAPLGYYGGPTRTMPPLPGSSAIDAGLNSFANFLGTDQRGYRRRSGARVDIGAVEVQQANPNNPPVLTQPALLPNGALQLAFTNDPAITFSIYASTNVAAPPNQWIRLGPTTQPSPGQYLYTDATATNHPNRFYNVTSP